MATKRKDFAGEETELETPEEVTTEKIAPVSVDHDYHREDLNELRDAVNYLLSK